MPIGGQNQTNRLGHGVLSKSETLAGQVTFAAAGEKTLSVIIAAVVAANARGPAWSPFEVRLIGSESGELRTKTTVGGLPLAQTGAANLSNTPTVIFLAQNDQSPSNDVLVYMSAASTLYVLLIG